jgi:exodeoxyribonuclease VII large subunit
MPDVVLSPVEFVALFNQTLEFAYPMVTIEGELSNFRVSKNRWVYFDLQDDAASVKFFGSVYNLPGPLEDGLKIRVVGSPRLHPRYGFSVNISSIAPVGQGSIKKAADLLAAKLQAEGLFEPERKRRLPPVPETIGLITAANSAAYADFIKILGERWGGVQIQLADVYVQGAQAPLQLARAIEYFNELPDLPDVLVITRGSGLTAVKKSFSLAIDNQLQTARANQRSSQEYLTSQVILHLNNLQNQLISHRKLFGIFNPEAALKRGYAIISRGRQHITSIKGLKPRQSLDIQLADGTIGASIQEIR